MKLRSHILFGSFALLAGLCSANSVRDIEVVANPGSNAVAVATVPGVNGWVNSVAIDTASGSTGNVAIAFQVSPSSMAARTIVSTNGITADLWLDPSDVASRRYAVTDKDTISLTVSNYTATAKQYRAVIRIETAK